MVEKVLSIIFLLSQSVCGEVFTASTDLTSTFQLEQQVVNILAELADRAEAKLDAIRRWILTYSLHTSATPSGQYTTTVHKQVKWSVQVKRLNQSGCYSKFGKLNHKNNKIKSAFKCMTQCTARNLFLSYLLLNSLSKVVIPCINLVTGGFNLLHFDWIALIWTIPMYIFNEYVINMFS